MEGGGRGPGAIDSKENRNGPAGLVSSVRSEQKGIRHVKSFVPRVFTVLPSSLENMGGVGDPRARGQVKIDKNPSRTETGERGSLMGSQHGAKAIDKCPRQSGGKKKKKKPAVSVSGVDGDTESPSFPNLRKQKPQKVTLP